MTAAERKRVESGSRASKPRNQLALAGDDAVNVESPARALQQMVKQAHSAGYPELHVAKWPLAGRLTLLAGMTVVSWTVLIAGARALLHA